MASKMFFSVLVALPLLSLTVSPDLLSVEASTKEGHVSHFRPSKLFVFGDSYADTGNGAISKWKVPYGITFPGKPVGRFSDGRVFTDFLAKYLGFKTPVAYRWRKTAAAGKKYGVNFAMGGSGVFDTVLVSGPNMTTQIDQLETLMKKEKRFTAEEIKSSLAVLVLSGNDYSTYLATHNGSTAGLPTFIPKVVNQLATNLQRVYALGVGKVAVTMLQPLGCLPLATYTTNFSQCNTSLDQLVLLHNNLVQQAVAKFNNETEPSTFVIIDLYSAFNSVIQSNGGSNSKFETPLRPCCVAVSVKYKCGSVDSVTGEKKYSLCPNPSSAFFWDDAHLTQEGWRVIFSKLHLQSVL